ncbi:MAG: TldD/PmbA family protein [Armatimonadota bacterium]|nr:MAG: TldD/PmbA family protein [Armatimonadota bacterium]
MKEVVNRAVQRAATAGATYADARVIITRHQSINTKNGTAEALTDATNQGIGIRLIADGAWGFASTSSTAPADVDDTADLAVRIARASATLSTGHVELGPQEPVQAEWSSQYEVDPFSLPLEKKLAFLLEADKIMREVPGLDVATGELNFVREEKWFASSEGAEIVQTRIQSGGSIEALAQGNGEVQRRSYPSSLDGDNANRGFEFVERMNLPANARRTAEEAVALLTADPCPSKTTTLILEGSQLALQVHESCGHPTELDRVFGTERSYAGTSFLTTDKLGDLRYGSDLVDLYADATIPGAMGSFGYDDEGVPAQRVDLVKQGIFSGYLSSRETAARLGLKSGGAMRASGWNRLPIIRMTNINLAPGRSSLEQMIRETDDGIYAATTKSWSIDDLRMNFQFATEIAWEIKSGQLGRIFRNTTYQGITPEFWGNCDAIASQDEWRPWGLLSCGKGEPVQIMWVGHGVAPARFRSVRIGVGGESG